MVIWGNAETMGVYAKMFHDLGYNVLVPDARGHGESQGDYIGFDGQNGKIMSNGSIKS